MTRRIDLDEENIAAGYSGFGRPRRSEDDDPPPLPSRWAGTSPLPPAAPSRAEPPASPHDAEPAPPTAPSAPAHWRSLDPMSVPPMPSLNLDGQRRMLGIVTRLVVVALAIAAAGAGAVALMRTDMDSVLGFLRGEKPVPMATELPPRLVVANQVAGLNERIRLGVAAEPLRDGMSVVIVGLPAGSQITAGQPSGMLGWRLPVRELADVQIVPPRDFLGAVEVMVDLRLADEAVTDRRNVQLEWRARSATEALPTRAAMVPPPAMPAPSSAPSPHEAFAALPPKAPDAPRAPEPSKAVPDAAVEALLKRGEDLAKQGDFASARLLLQRAADMRHAGAALALGATFDPVVLKKLGVVGTVPDAARARLWYGRAAEYGSAEASRRLEILAQESR
jgi:hypothetical protein